MGRDQVQIAPDITPRDVTSATIRDHSLKSIGDRIGRDFSGRFAKRHERLKAVSGRTQVSAGDVLERGVLGIGGAENPTWTFRKSARQTS
jgi:hypothetical protein